MLTTSPATSRSRVRLACAALFALSLTFWALIFARSILSPDDLAYIERGRTELVSWTSVVDMFHYDVIIRNGRIADPVLSLVAAAGGEPLVRGYYAISCTLAFPTALIWLNHLLPRRTRDAVPSLALPLVAASVPFLLLALDRRLIPDLILFGAASSGYWTGLFLVTLGLVPALRAVDGRPTSRRAATLGAIPLVVGVLFHEVLGTLVLGCLVAVAYLAVRLRGRRRALIPSAIVLTTAVALKAATPGLWTRAADTDQRVLGNASLLDRTDAAIAFAALAFIPLLAYVAGSLALQFPNRDVSARRLVALALTGVALSIASLGYRFLDGYPMAGIMTTSAIGAVALAAIALRPAGLQPVETVAVAATLMSFAVPIYGGLYPGRAWFFGEFIALMLALSWLIRTVTDVPDTASLVMPAPLLAIALAGAGIVVAPVVAYEMLDKVNDNYVWRAFVAEQVRGQADGTVEIPWTYPWDDMRPSFALDREHELFEPIVRTYFGIDDDTDVVWTDEVYWTTD